MSSQSSGRPDFRLNFGHPFITLTEPGRAEPLDRIDLADPDIVPRLRALGDTVARAGGRLTVVLPESEVWRGALELRARTPLARRAEARSAVAARLSVPAGSLSTVLGWRGASGGTPAVAVKHATLAETRAFLRLAAIRPDAIIGAGAFPGFATPPRLGPPIWRDITRARVDAPRSRGAAAALAIGAACLALAFTLTLARIDGRSTPPVTAVAASQSTAASNGPVASVDLAEAFAPRPRPVAPRTRIAHVAPSGGAAPRAPEATPRPLVTQASRNMPELVGVKVAGLSDARPAERVGTPAKPTDAAVVAPPPRPGVSMADLAKAANQGATVQRATAGPAVRPAAIAVAARPLRRPAATAASPTAASPAAATASAAGLSSETAPRPRVRRLGGAPPTALSAAITDAVGAVNPAWEPDATVRVAALTSTATDATAAPLAASPPEPRPARPARVARPVLAAPIRVALAKPVAAAPVVRVQPVRAVVQPVQPRVTPAVVREANLAPRRLAATAAPAQPVRAASARPAVEKSGLSRGSVSLLGVFGSQAGRHALLRLSNGTVKRVRPGDSIQGTQVAAVGSDSVLLTSGGRETVLRMQ